MPPLAARLPARRRLNNLLQMMEAMTQEAGTCSTTSCGGACPAGHSVISTSRSGCSGSSRKSRCCPTAAYPDVFILADR
jgi:hypothetical protein